MKRAILGSALLLTTLALPACQSATTNAPAPETNRSDLKTETVDRAGIEREIIRIESDWPRVIKEKDVEAVRRVEGDDLVIVYPDGSLGNKEAELKDIGSGAVSVDSLEILDLKVNVLDADSAVASGRTVIKGGKYTPPGGKPIDITGEYRFVDTFHKRNGEWKLVAGASVPVRQPAGAGTTASPAATMSPTASPATSPSPK